MTKQVPYRLQYVTEDRLVGPVSGAPHYNGGRLLGILPMEDENGNPTSTGSTQFQYVKELIITWNINDTSELCPLTQPRSTQEYSVVLRPEKRLF